MRQRSAANPKVGSPAARVAVGEPTCGKAPETPPPSLLVEGPAPSPDPSVPAAVGDDEAAEFPQATAMTKQQQSRLKGLGLSNPQKQELRRQKRYLPPEEGMEPDGSPAGPSAGAEVPANYPWRGADRRRTPEELNKNPWMRKIRAGTPREFLSQRVSIFASAPGR